MVVTVEPTGRVEKGTLAELRPEYGSSAIFP
jgi:hypothetical protein